MQINTFNRYRHRPRARKPIDVEQLVALDTEIDPAFDVSELEGALDAGFNDLDMSQRRTTFEVVPGVVAHFGESAPRLERTR